MAEKVCKKCVKIYGRDTNLPIKCLICDKRVGCHHHSRNAAHAHLMLRHPNEVRERTKTQGGVNAVSDVHGADAPEN